MWNIHGKKYDLTKFLAKHPGGASILEACKGEHDCTASFESYHSLCDMEKIQRIMKGYEIHEKSKPESKPESKLESKPESKPESKLESKLKSKLKSKLESKLESKPIYSFDNAGFYKTVQSRVKKYFTENKIDHHANYFWLFKILPQTLLFIISLYFAFYTNILFWLRMLLAGISGHMLMQFGFTVMHDASHCAISKNPRINDFLSRTWNSLALWDHHLWMVHHVYRHHAFTADPKLDPDTIHLRPFVKKIEQDKNTKYIELFLKYPKLITLLTCCVLPGIHVGQIISYTVWLFRRRLWNMNIGEHKHNLYESLLKLFMLFTFCWSGSFLIVYVFLTMASITYFVCIMPDHDMFENSQIKIETSQKEKKEKKEKRENESESNIHDWGEMQVRNSGNFSMSNRLMTECFGGINYQIEHHLFPSVCHVHYKDISKIVQNTCKEFSIPYTSHETVIKAVMSVLRNFESVKSIKST
jgi:linoleoyl-CoA desaturase